MVIDLNLFLYSNLLQRFKSIFIFESIVEIRIYCRDLNLFLYSNIWQRFEYIDTQFSMKTNKLFIQLFKYIFLNKIKDYAILLLQLNLITSYQVN